MAREISIIIIILVIIFAADFIVINHLKTSTEVLSTKIEEINANIDNKEKANGLIDELNEQWEKTNKTWSIIVTHQELDQIETSLLSAKISIENEEKNEALIELGKLNFLLEHINETQSFKLKNIF